ncbi:MAG: acyltransferase [Candidatus Binatus sp.]|jgi:surface polysaccharide O-acyltransferase-like enzyme|uniref:acyltransferase family protein n=1 Tax=Candidatus Binatus sp. TaxID=2811406 RepID=UPI003D0C5F1F
MAITTSPRRDVSIDYLRATLTLMVLAHHSSLAYTTFAHFDKQDIYRSTAPVVDVTRWLFLDYAENFNDVFFMSLMFFVSGLFVYPALRRHGTYGFIRGRLLRLGLPFSFSVVFLMPVAYYASWQLTGRSTGFADFYRRLAEHGFASGPEWFIWVLLFFGVVLALILVPLQRWMAAAERLMLSLRDHPFVTFTAIYFLAALVYLPLLARYGFGAWADLVTSPFSFQICRIGLYALWFVFGFLVGAPSFADGLLSREGPLARHWRLWISGCFVAYNALVIVPRVYPQPTLEAFLWVLSCVASCFGFLALFRGIEMTPRLWMNSLSRSAYVMYLVHYVFITWTQRVVLDRPIHAGIKFLFVFLSTTLLSWLTAQILLRIPKLKTIL